MKICLMQIRPVAGDVQGNAARHLRLIDTAVPHHPDLIIFPELSLTGYEPTLAKELAMDVEDGRLQPFQQLADAHQMTVGVGAPIRQEDGICIGMVLLRPCQPRQLYAKKYLHPDEEPYFVSGQSTVSFIGDQYKVALAICYELSAPEHAADAHEQGAAVYVASVAKHARGVTAAHQRLATIARDDGLTVLMANCVGLADGDVCAGESAVWNEQGELAAQLDDSHEGIIVYDTAAQEVVCCFYHSPSRRHL